MAIIASSGDGTGWAVGAGFWPGAGGFGLAAGWGAGFAAGLPEGFAAGLSG